MNAATANHRSRPWSPWTTAAIAALLLSGSLRAEDWPPFLTSWGSNGSGPGQLSAPIDLAVDAAGNTYVCDFDNDRIQKFDARGTFLGQWGSRGTEPGEFRDPSGVAVGPTGDVYVADRRNDRVQKFTADGTFLLEWGRGGSGNGRFRAPCNVATDASGDVFVVDPGNTRVQKFDSEGNYLTQFGDYYYYGSGNPCDGSFSQPYGITVDLEGNVYVGDYGKRVVQKFDGDGNFLLLWGGPGAGDGEFDYPLGLGTDRDGNVYVADLNNRNIQKFDGDGNFLAKIDTVGGGDGELLGPMDVEGGPSNVLTMVDADLHRMQMFGETDFALAADVDTLGAGDDLRLRNYAGTAGRLALLFVLEVNSAPFTLVLTTGTMDANGTWTYSTGIPPGLAGMTVTLRTFSQNELGKIIQTNDEVLSFD